MSSSLPSPTKVKSPLTLLSQFGFGLLFLWLAARQFHQVDKYAVNLLFWDQWDLYQPFFDGKGPCELFRHQHGPHRQGVGFLLTRALAFFSDWNTRWDSFAVFFLMLGAACLSLKLALRCGLKFGLSLAAIPLFFFNLRQYESFVGAANPSHGAMPLLLLMAYCLVWFWENSKGRLILLSLLNFLLVFTGFGLFVGLISPVLLGLELLHSLRQHKSARPPLWPLLLALASCVLAWVLFAWGYSFASFSLCQAPFRDYLFFIALMFANFFGMPAQGTLSLGVGLSCLSALLLLCLWHGWVLLRHGLRGKAFNITLFTLSSYALLYTANTAWGRLILGLVEAPAASRYVPLMIPGCLALFLQLAQLPLRPFRALVPLCLAGLTAWGTLLLRPEDIKSLKWYSEGKQHWKEAYLASLNEKQADQASNFQVYPVSVKERLAYLRKHKLNLFNENPHP